MTHFIGIGGIGMSALAFILLERGVSVSGSDHKQSPITKELEKRGAKIGLGLVNAKEIVVSTAISEENPEYQLAKKMGLPILHRSELLEREMRKQKGIYVTGCHGKTSTSALLAHTLHVAGVDPSYLVGGQVSTLPAHGHLGAGEYFVTEADESDGSFLRGTPAFAIITSAEPDHLDFWKTPEKVHGAYKQFCAAVTDTIFACADCPFLQEIHHQGESYGTSSYATWQLHESKQTSHQITFTISHKGEKLAPITLHAIGEHQALNALAVFALAIRIGIPEGKIREAFLSFRGVKRRAEFLGDFAGALFYDDYAHHPTEVTATLKALRSAYPNRRLVALFQPHRYSRFVTEWHAFKESFIHTDKLLITDVWSAGETPLLSSDPKLFAEELQSCYLGREELPEKLSEQLTANDLVVTLGAGDITNVLRQVLEEESCPT